MEHKMRLGEKNTYWESMNSLSTVSETQEIWKWIEKDAQYDCNVNLYIIVGLRDSIKLSIAIILSDKRVCMHAIISVAVLVLCLSIDETQEGS